MKISMLPIVAALASSCIGSIAAASSRQVIDELPGAPQPAARLEQIGAGTQAAFEATLQEYDAYIDQHPFDVIAQLRRCRFIEDFAASYEYASFVDEIYEQSEQCDATLAEDYPEHPEVLLVQLQGLYGHEQLKRGAALLREIRVGAWTAGQMARLYTLLAQTAGTLGHAEALDYALRALDLDETSDVHLIAAALLIDHGDKKRALQILSSPLAVASAGEEGWWLVRKMELLALLGAHSQVVETHAALTSKVSYNHAQAARWLRAAGAIELARHELNRAAGLGPGNEKERFELELEVGTPEAALVAYNAWRDLGWKQDPLGVNRIALLSRDLLLPWKARDLLGLLGLVLSIAVVGLCAVVPLSFIHYRGLARRAKSGEAYPTSGWQLRHAWAALFAFGLASLLSLYAAGAIDLLADGSLWVIDATPAQLARIALVESFLAVTLLLPLGALARRRQPAWWGLRWSIGKSVLLGAAIGLAFRVPMLLGALVRPETAPLLAPPDDPIWQMMRQIHEQFGVAAALWVLAIAAPVIEEIIFRGVLLKALSQHVSFGWANACQGALFSAMHMNAKAAVLLFIVGTVLGALTRRSGGLLAPMVMHAVFNLTAALVFL
jgi:uncharacterized protein